MIDYLARRPVEHRCTARTARTRRVTARLAADARARRRAAARPLRIAVVGGGMAGLGAARVLEDARAADPSVDWHLYEDEPRFGGKVHTVRRDGFVVEGGPDSAIIEKHWPITTGPPSSASATASSTPTRTSARASSSRAGACTSCPRASSSWCPRAWCRSPSAA